MSGTVDLEPLSVDQLMHIYVSDTDMFPSQLSLTSLLAWHVSAPEYFLSLTAQNRAIGSLIALPIPDDAWAALIHGDLQEHEITPLVVSGAVDQVNAGHGGTVALHFWHVERSDVWVQVTEMRYASVVQQFIHAMQERGIHKMSALTASVSGEALFTRLGFHKEDVYDYICQQTDGGSRVVHTKGGLQEIEQSTGLTIKQECSMMVLM